MIHSRLLFLELLFQTQNKKNVGGNSVQLDDTHHDHNKLDYAPINNHSIKFKINKIKKYPNIYIYI